MTRRLPAGATSLTVAGNQTNGVRRPSSMRTSMVLRVSMVLMVVAALGLAACGSDDSATPPATPMLDGRTFLSTDITDHESPKSLVDGTRIRLSFVEGHFGVSGGCNSGSAAYSILDGHLKAEEIGMTEMGCDEPRMAQDDWILAVLADRPAITLDGDTLTLVTDRVTLVLRDREIVDPDRPLADTVWIGTTLIDGTSASTSAVVAAVRLTFGADGSVAVDAGCNSGGARYEATGAVISFRSLALTDTACDKDRTAVEQHVVAVLDGDVAFTIDGGSLTLTNGDVGLGLRADDQAAR